MEKKQDQIFEEMDEKTSARTTCTCGTMFALLVALLIASIIGLLYAITLIKTRIDRPKITLTQVSVQEVLTKVQSFLSDHKQTPAAQLVITDEELNTLLAQSKNENLPIKGLQATITPDAIIFTGTLTKPLTSDLNFHAVPVVLNGSVDFKITKLRAGKVTLPQPLIEIISGQISSAIKNNLTIFQGIDVKEVVLASGSMVVK